MSLERGSEFIIAAPNIGDGLLGRTRRRIKSQRQDAAQLFPLCGVDDRAAKSFGLLRATARTAPTLTSESPVTPVFLLALLDMTAQRPTSTKSVAIMLLRVK